MFAAHAVQSPRSVVLIVVIYSPAAHVTCSVQLVPSNQYPALHEAHWSLPVLAATATHVAQEDSDPVEHV